MGQGLSLTQRGMKGCEGWKWGGGGMYLGSEIGNEQKWQKEVQGERQGMGRMRWAG